MTSSRAASRIWRGADVPQVTAARLAVELPGAARGQTVTVVERVEAARAEGYEQGRADALAEAAAGAEAERSRRLAALTDALVAAAGASVEARRAAVSAAEAEVVALAVELAETLLGRELALGRSAVSDALRRALTLVPDGEDLLVRVHPDDLLEVPELTALVPDRQVRVVPDEGVEPGGCVVDAGPCHVDAQIGPALARARQLLATLSPASEAAAEGEGPPSAEGPSGAGVPTGVEVSVAEPVVGGELVDVADGPVDVVDVADGPVDVVDVADGPVDVAEPMAGGELVDAASGAVPTPEAAA